MTPSLTTLGMGLDPRAAIFIRGDRVLRAIRPGHEKFYTDLLAQPYIQALIAEGLLIATSVSAETVPGFTLVLEHPLIAPLTFPFEWPALMFKAAAEATLALNIRLMEHGCCTVDGHPWNILFDGTRPVFIDFTSIVPLPADGRWHEALEFYHTFVSALRLMEKGYPTVARQLLREVRGGPDPALANAVLLNSKRFEPLPRGRRAVQKTLALVGHFTAKITKRARTAGIAAATLPVLRALAEEVRAMEVAPGEEMWSGYYDGRADVGYYDGTPASLDALLSKSPKHQAVERLLERLRPATVLDLACNRGPYSQMAARKGARVVGVDTDESALDLMFRDSAALGTGAIPLYMNVVTPAEPVSFRERPFPDVAERLRSDCVLCLALVHHLVSRGHRISFAQAAGILAAFTEKHLIVEFVPAEDRAMSDFLKTRSAEFRDAFLAWYSLANFKAALAPHFPTIEEFPSFPETRTLLLCSR